MSLKPVVFCLMLTIHFIISGANSEYNNKVDENDISEFPERLPSWIYPINYDLFLRPHMGQQFFDGNVTILFNITKPTSTIFLHSKKLDILYTELFAAEERVPIPIMNSYEYKKHEYWVSELYEELPKGLYEISLGFESKPSNQTNRGFYQVSYHDEDSNDTRWVAAAQFQPADARSAFPCFDEPEMKATFKIQLQHPHDNGYFALSNMDIERVERHENFSVTTFNRSIKMSTYLVQFVVCDFQGESVTVDTKGVGSPFELKVFGEKRYENETNKVLHIAKDAIEYLIDYYKIPFPLPKMDIVAIPGMKYPALETWGLTIFRPSVLFGEMGKTFQGYAIAHEVSHSWFGNLVTMKWWDEIWLNEGFATFIGMKVIEKIRPELEAAGLFWRQYIDSVFRVDCLLSTHPIIQNSPNTSAKALLFDDITYIKAAFVIQMLEDYIGADSFKLAVTNYLKRYSFGNAETYELVNELQNVESSHQLDVGVFLKAWTRQPGYPIVNVDRVEDGSFKLTQKRYFSKDLLRHADTEDYNYTWPIPINLRTDGNGKPHQILFNMEDEEVDVTLPNITWAIFNARKVGYFKVNYSTEMWYEFSDILANANSTFDYGHRYNLWKDATDLVENDQLEIDVVLNLFKALRKENSSRIWNMAYKAASTVLNILDEEVASEFSSYCRLIVDGFLQEYPNIFNEFKEEFRGVYKFSCVVNHDQCLAMAKQYFQSYISVGDSPIWWQLPHAVRAAAIRNSLDGEYLVMWRLCQENWDDYLCIGLAGVHNETFLDNFIDYIVDSSKFENFLFAELVSYASETNFTLVWNRLHSKWKDLNTRQPQLALDYVILNLLPFFVDNQLLPEIRQLLETYSQKEKYEQQELYIRIENAIKLNMRRNESVKTLLRNKSLI